MAENHPHTDDHVVVSEGCCHDEHEHHHDEHEHLRGDAHHHDRDHHRHEDDGHTHLVSEEVLVSEFEQVTVYQPVDDQEKEGHHGLTVEKLQRSYSSSSSSSSDEEGDSEEKKKKKKEKKGLQEKIKEKICGEGADQKPASPAKVDPVVVVAEAETAELVQVVAVAEEGQEHPLPAKKGFLEKIKEKLPGVHSAPPVTPTDVVVEGGTEECESPPAKEKKGLLEKIKEKLPGYHPKSTGGDQETANH